MSPGSPKAYQVLAILGNPTFKPPPRGLQEITNGSHGWSPKNIYREIFLTPQLDILNI